MLARISSSLLLAALVGCTSTPTVTPREYLDETTAATITVVAEPCVFTSARTDASAERDFINVYAIDVNRMGDHRQYLAVLQWWPVADSSGAYAAPTLELATASGTLTLQPASEEPRKLGIAQPIAPLNSPSSRWWYFPVNKEALTTIAGAHDLQVEMVVRDKRTHYTMWSDGRAQLAELTTMLH